MTDHAEAKELVLHWSPRSPFVRKVMIALHEKDLVGSVTAVRSVVPTDDRDHPIFADNPLGTVPTLVTADGQGIFDSSVILEYLDLLRAEPRLFPEDAGTRITVRRSEAMCDGLLEAMLKWRVETMRPSSFSPTLIGRVQNKADKTLNNLEQRAGTRAFDGIDAETVAAAATLAYLDFRFPNLDWRNGRPVLSDWHAKFSLRPSMQMTEFADG